MRVAMDPRRNRRSHQTREVAGKAGVESRPPVFPVNAARMRQVMSYDDGRAGKLVRQPVPQPARLLEVHRPRMLGAEQGMGAVTDDAEVIHSVPGIAHRATEGWSVAAV